MDDWMGVYRMGILIRVFEGLFLLASLRAGFVHVHVVPTKAGAAGSRKTQPKESGKIIHCVQPARAVDRWAQSGRDQEPNPTLFDHDPG